MNIITKIGLKGVGPFRNKVVFRVPSGISYLYGKNLNDGGNPNAAGKSVLASAVAEIFYDQPVVGTKQDKAKNGERFVEFKRGKNLVRVGSVFNGRKSKLTMKVNGEDVSGRTNKNTKLPLEKYWPIGFTDYMTYAYVDSTVPHPLARGTTAERKAFFNRFFGLDQLDAEKKLVLAAMLRLKKSRAALEELQASYNEVKSGLLSQDAVEKMEAKAERLTAKVAKLQDAAAAYQRAAALIEFKKLAAPHVKLVGTENIRERLKQCRRLLASAERYEEELADWKAYTRSLAKYKEATKDLDMDVPMRELEEAHRVYSRHIEEPERPEKVEKPEKPEGSLKELQVEEAQLEHSLEHSKKFKQGKCPTCGSVVKAASPEKLERQLQRVQEALEEHERYAKRLRAYERYKEERKTYEEDLAEYEKLREAKKKAKKKATLYERRKAIVKPEKVEKPEAPAGVETAKKQLASLEFLLPHEDRLEQLDGKDEELVPFDAAELADARDKLSDLNASLSVHRSVEGQAKKLRKRIKALKAELVDEAALKLLLAGYNDNAVKKGIIDAITSHLEVTLNAYSDMVFNGYRFEFSWGAQVQLLVHRPGMETTDVRKLSGAENKMFTLILIMALLKFVPKRKRLSLLVLDEPTASFSKETTALFHKLLPQLNALVPSILVVTPKSAERFEGAHEFTVVRDRSGAVIKEGHPSET